MVPRVEAVIDLSFANYNHHCVFILSLVTLGHVRDNLPIVNSADLHIYPFLVEAACSSGKVKGQRALIYIYTDLSTVTRCSTCHTSDMNMPASTASILSLSDDVLLYMLRKLDNMDVLYSLVGVNRQLDRVARDVMFARCLDFTCRASADAQGRSVLDRFCSDILPGIQHHVQHFTLHHHTLDRVLHVGNYPRLRQLTIHNVPCGRLSATLDDSSTALHAVRKQISHLTLLVRADNLFEQTTQFCGRTFAQVLTTFECLTHFHFGTDGCWSRLPISAADLLSTTYCSSTVTHLNISLSTFDACLHLLDGRLSQLRSLHVDVRYIRQTATINKNLVEILRMALTC